MPKSHSSFPTVWLLLLAAALAAAMLGCSMLGVVHFGWDEMWQSSIFWNLRAPRIVLSVLVGAALSVCGAAYQSVFRNPLTDPYVLGISSGASVGAAVAILLGLEAYMLGVGACALVTGLLTIVVIYRIASIGNRMHTTTLLLTGVCITFLMSAIISFIMVLRQDKMDSIIFWTMGSFASASWTEVAIVAPVVAVGIGIVLYYARDLNLLLAGSETVPHCLRLVLGPDNRRIVPCAIFAGGLFMLLCDTLARTLLMPAELPVGSLTALAGAPLFIYLLYKNKKRY